MAGTLKHHKTWSTLQTLLLKPQYPLEDSLNGFLPASILHATHRSIRLLSYIIQSLQEASHSNPIKRKFKCT